MLRLAEMIMGLAISTRFPEAVGQSSVIHLGIGKLAQKQWRRGNWRLDKQVQRQADPEKLGETRAEADPKKFALAKYGHI